MLRYAYLILRYAYLILRYTETAEVSAVDVIYQRHASKYDRNLMKINKRVPNILFYNVL